MFGLGKSRSILEDDDEAFHVRTWEWLIDCAGLKFLRARPLVLPTAAFFPPTDLKGHARAGHILGSCQTHAGMAERPVRLLADRAMAGRVSTFVHVQNPKHAVGTFSHAGNGGQITYNESLLQQPVALIATFAHELGHYFNDGFRFGHPDGSEVIEPATDITATFLGFGVFGANSAFEFRRFQDFESQGWSSSRLGYIGEDAWAFDLAMFCALTGRELADAKPHLKSHIWGQAARAQKYLTASGVCERLLERSEL